MNALSGSKWPSRSLGGFDDGPQRLPADGGSLAQLPLRPDEALVAAVALAATAAGQDLRSTLFEEADGGTLLLDEIGEMPVDLQAKLLKVIEDRSLRRLGGEREIQVDVQVLAATNQNLEEQIYNGEFRADLYHRLSVFKLQLPALADRLEDLEDLVVHQAPHAPGDGGKELAGIEDGEPRAYSYAELLPEDARWKFGIPPKGNANFAWVQHFIYHLAPNGIAGFVLANGSMSSMTGGEGEIRQRLVEEEWKRDEQVLAPNLDSPWDNLHPDRIWPD